MRRRSLAAMLTAAVLMGGGAGATVLVAQDPAGPTPSIDSRTGTPYPAHIAGEPEVIAERDGAKFIVSPGKGHTAGMICFHKATPEVTVGGCDSQALFERHGAAFSEDIEGGRLALTVYLPAGYSSVDLGTGLPVHTGRVIDTVVSRDQRTITATGSAGEIEIEVPGSRQIPEG